jgi:hypothetical protein
MGLCRNSHRFNWRNGGYILYTEKLQAPVNSGTEKLEPYFFIPFGSLIYSFHQYNPFVRILDIRCSSIVCFAGSSIFLPDQELVSQTVTLVNGSVGNSDHLCSLKIEMLIVPLRFNIICLPTFDKGLNMVVSLRHKRLNKYD